MNRFDLTPYRRSTVGFDRIFDLLESSTRLAQGDNYPPFNIERTGEESYAITLAVAGFTEEEIEITANASQLVVSGSKSEEQREDREYLHMGIATRNFERRFQLADFIRVEGAELADGMLTIRLHREVPDEMKPRKIEIGSGSNVRQIGSKSAA